MEFFYLAFTLFILMDAFGNIPLYISLLQHIDPKRQRIIILRELLIAYGVIVLFAIAGDEFLSFLHIQRYTIRLTGGIILFLTALKMIFPSSLKNDSSSENNKKGVEPFLVPLAIPLIAGPVVLAAVMLYATQYPVGIVIGASAVAWAFCTLVLVFSPFIGRKIGPRGVSALERLMGLILILMAVDMFCEGIRNFTISIYSR